MICRLTPQLVKVEYHRGQPGVNIAGAKPGSELGESLFGIGAGRISRSAKARARRTMLLLADAKIRSDQDVERWILGPIFGELFDIEERHFVYYGVAVSAGSGEEAIDVSPGRPISLIER